MSIHLSKERFESTPYGALISWGVIENSPDGVFMTRDGPKYLVLGSWKGEADDWAIYVMPTFFGPIDPPDNFLEYLHGHGDKVHDARWIDRMVHADPEVNARYRR